MAKIKLKSKLNKSANSNWEIVEDLPKFQNAGLIKNAPVNPASFQAYQQANPAKGAPTNPIILPEVNITAPRAQYPTELGKRLQYSRDENQKLKDAAAEERWTNSYKGEQGLGNDIIGEQIGFGALAKSLSSIKPIASELTGIGKNAIQNTWKLNPSAKTAEELFTKGSLKNDIPLSNPEFIQRGVGTQEAIDDILNTGIVRNRQSAGLPSKNRWGEKVYWGEKDSPLASNKFNIIAKNSNGLENRPVTAQDIQDILVRNEQGNYTSLPNWQEQINKPHWLKGYKEIKQPLRNRTEIIPIKDTKSLNYPYDSYHDFRTPPNFKPFNFENKDWYKEFGENVNTDWEIKD